MNQHVGYPRQLALQVRADVLQSRGMRQPSASDPLRAVVDQSYRTARRVARASTGGRDRCDIGDSDRGPRTRCPSSIVLSRADPFMGS